jgi:hypothetical protein
MRTMLSSNRLTHCRTHVGSNVVAYGSRQVPLVGC